MDESKAGSLLKAGAGLRGMRLGSTAPRWKCALAYLLGTRVEGRDGSAACIGYMWRGKLYLTECLPPNTGEKQK